MSCGRLSVDRWCFPLMGYTPLWRYYRREFHQFFKQPEMHKYHHIQLHECQMFLRRMLEDPHKLDQHIYL